MAIDAPQDERFNNKNVARAAFKVTLGNVFTLVAGIGSQIFVAALFGAGLEMDAYLTALVIPIYLHTVLLGGLSFVFIPAFVRASMEEREENAWELVGTFFWLILAVLSILALVGILLSQDILSLSAPGLSPVKSELAKALLMILMISVPFTGLATLTGGIQNARNRYFWPAVAPAIGSVGNLITLIIFYQRIGPLALAWGFVVSSVIRSSITVIPILRHGWTKRVPISDPRALEMLKLITPFIVFGLVTRSPQLFERMFASRLPDGELSYLGYADKIANSLGSLLRPGIAVAIFPAMAAAFVKNGNEGLVDRTEFGIRLTLATSLPALAIISATAVPLIMVLYERGAFLHSVTLSVSSILSFIAIREIVLRMLGNVIVRAFYVTKDTRTPPSVSVMTTGIYLGMASLLVGIGGFFGLALAKPSAAVFGTITLSVLLIRKLKLFNLQRMLKDTTIYVLMSGITFLGALLFSNALADFPAFIRLVAAGSVGVAIYLSLISRFDPEIFESIVEMTGVNKVFSRAKLTYSRIKRSTH